VISKFVTHFAVLDIVVIDIPPTVGSNLSGAHPQIFVFGVQDIRSVLMSCDKLRLQVSSCQYCLQREIPQPANLIGSDKRQSSVFSLGKYTV